MDVVTLLRRIQPPLGFGKFCPHRVACKVKAKGVAGCVGTGAPSPGYLCSLPRGLRVTIQPASQRHVLYACSDRWRLMEGTVLGTRRDAVNLHGAAVFQGPEDKDLPVLAPTPRGWHWWAGPCPAGSPQCRGTPRLHWDAPHLHLVQEGNAGPCWYLATSAGL